MRIIEGAKLVKSEVSTSRTQRLIYKIELNRYRERERGGERRKKRERNDE